jgi:hypothetical protein
VLFEPDLPPVSVEPRRLLVVVDPLEDVWDEVDACGLKVANVLLLGLPVCRGKLVEPDVSVAVAPPPFENVDLVVSPSLSSVIKEFSCTLFEASSSPPG